MKKVCLFFFLCLSLSWLPAKVNAQTSREIIERHWMGSSVKDVNFTKDGKLYLVQKLRIKVNPDNTFTGMAFGKMTLDGVDYSTSVEVSGTFNPADGSITYKCGETVMADKLPGDLRWCNAWGTLKLYDDTESYDHYILKGSIQDDCGGNSELEYKDE